MLAKEGNYSPSALGDFNRPLKAKLEHYSKLDIAMWFMLLKWYRSGKKFNLNHCCACKIKLNAQLNSQSELVSMVSHAQWDHPKIRQTEHTKYSTYEQRCTGSKSRLKMPPPTTFFGNSEWCAVLRVTGLHFQLLHMTHLWHRNASSYLLTQNPYSLGKWHSVVTQT